jgi:enamine deaminase RidA (YjgF/YER057c/UK114 family)
VGNAGQVRHAPLVRAGKWIFGTGLRATNALGHIDPGVSRDDRPLDPPPRAQREAEFIFHGLGRALGGAGSALSNVVRVDQYFSHWRAVDPYHVARKQALGGVAPPSTSVLVGGLLNPGAQIDVQVIAMTLDSSLATKPVGVAGLAAPKESGYSPCTQVGDLVFVAGQLARDESGNIAPEAQVQPGQLWKGTRIALETRYLVERRLRPSLQAADSDLDCVLKAQVYLSHAEDLPAFWQVWSESFGGTAPPTLVVPLRHPAFGTEDATVEINLVAAKASARSRIRDIECGIELVAPGMVPARSFDGLLFVAGLMGIDREGLVPEARIDRSIPFFQSTARAQMADILGKARKIFAAAGSDLENVVRVLQFHSDLGDFYDTYAEWRSAIGDAGLPFSAVKTGSDLLIPGASLIVDLWGSVPGKA